MSRLRLDRWRSPVTSSLRDRRAVGKPAATAVAWRHRRIDDGPVAVDAIAGVEAGKAGGMAVIGIARGHDAGLLAAAGADIVVTTLDEVDRAALAAGRLVVERGR
jgi:phosphoglycolate phosphatase-like HAD superfamily hydrolase